MNFTPKKKPLEHIIKKCAKNAQMDLVELSVVNAKTQKELTYTDDLQSDMIVMIRFTPKSNKEISVNIRHRVLTGSFFNVVTILPRDRIINDKQIEQLAECIINEIDLNFKRSKH